MLTGKVSVNEEARNKKVASNDKVLFQNNEELENVLKQNIATRGPDLEGQINH